MIELTTMETLTVSQYLDRINLKLKTETAKIIGEITGLKLHQNGHYYFSLLDKTDQSKIDCVIWRSNYKLFGVDLKDGIEVTATVAPNIYKLNGRISFIVSSIELVGEGALKIAYEKLKKKLDLEGLFAEERKRDIPEYPHKIGVITSKSGAVINDFLTNIGKFGYEIVFVDSKVEGADAIKELMLALKVIKERDIDVLVMMRGGGSLESFQAFNNEVLVREVASFPVPVITGIGHDKDLPLVSYVSDKNVSTPTAVANLLNSTWRDAEAKVKLSEERIISIFSQALSKKKFFIENSVIRMDRGMKAVSEFVKRAEEVLFTKIEEMISDIGNILEQSKKTLSLVDPKRQLKKGYSIVKSVKGVVKSVSQVKKGDKLDIMLSDGSIDTQVI
ncbi:MAG: exodeoxyribonuclease VII large subunit [Minisyncoccia bacterium]